MFKIVTFVITFIIYIIVDRKCIQLCEKKGVMCEDGARVAQMITYSVVPLHSNVIQPYQDITSLSPYGLKHDLLPRTVFRITENESGKEIIFM